MKKIVKFVSLALVFAFLFTLCSCKKDVARRTRDDDDDTEYDEELDDDDDDPVIVNDPSDFGNTGFDRSSVVENVQFAQACLGGDPVSVCDAICDVYNFSGTDSAYDYYEGHVSFWGDGFDMDGAFIKCVHFYLDKDYSVVEVDFCITEEQFLSMGAKESDYIDSDLNLPAKEAYESVCKALEKKYGAPQMCDTSWLKADNAESVKWELGNNVVVAATWGENCFGIAGNNQLEIAISADSDFVPGCNALLPTSDVLDPELEGIIAFGKSCFGQDQDTVKKMIEDYLNVELGDGTKLTEDSDNTVEYLYEGLDYTIAEVKFSEISIISNPDSGKVFNVIFWNLKVTPDQQQYDYALYMHKFVSYYGKPVTYFFNDVSSYMLDDNTEIMFGGSSDNYDTYFYLIIQNEDYN